MKTNGFVLVVCLCFVAIVSSMACSVLLISQLSQKISWSGQRQLQLHWQAKPQHWQQLRQLAAAAEPALTRPCQPQAAVWTQQQPQCHWQILSSAGQGEAPVWSSLVQTQTLPLAAAGGVL